MKNGLASSMEGSGQLLLKLVSSGNKKRNAGESQGVSFKELVQSVINSKNPAPTQESSVKQQKNTGSGNLKEGSETQGWYKTMPREEAAAARDRLQTLVEDGSLSTEELDDMSTEELEELMMWLLSGANGLFESQENVTAASGASVETGFNASQSDLVIAEDQSLLEGDLQDIESNLSGDVETKHPAETGIGAEQIISEEDSFQNFDLFKLNNMSADADKGAEKVISEEGSSRIFDLFNLNNLSVEESDALEKSLTKILEASQNNLSNPDLDNTDSLVGKKHELQDILANMSKEEVAGLLKSAANDAGMSELFANESELKEIPKGVLQALSVKLLKVEKEGSELSAGQNEGSDAEKLLSELRSKMSLRNENNSQKFGQKEESLTENHDKAQGENNLFSLKGKVERPFEEMSEYEVEDIDVRLKDSSEFTEKLLKPESLDFDSSESRKFGHKGVDDLISEAGKVAESRSAVQAKTNVTQRYVDTDQNIEKISQIMKMNVRRGISTATLQLAPAELGKVKLQISMQGGIMNASVKTDNADARNMLLGNVAQLRDTLTSQGIKFGEFDIYYENDEASQNSPQDFTNQFSRRRGSNRPQNRVFSLEEEVVEEKTGVIGDGFVNMIA